MRLFPYQYTVLYAAMVPFLNWAWEWAPFFTLPDGGDYTPFSVLVGLVLVVRDFAQREVGHKIFIPLLFGVVMSYVLADPRIATASAAAFLMSEMVDWGVYTFTKKPLSQRILISSAVGAPIDSVVFLWGASAVVENIFSPLNFTLMLASKMLGAVVIWYLLRRQGA